MDAATLDHFAEEMGGRGCVVKDGYVVKAWGSQSDIGEWYSSAKPVLTTLLLFAIQKHRIPSVDTPIAQFESL